VRRGLPLDGAGLFAWVVAKHLDRLGSSSDASFHANVMFLASLASHITRKDDEFMVEWTRIHQGVKDGDRVTMEVRYKELGAIITSLDRRGVLGKKPLPHDSLRGSESEGDGGLGAPEIELEDPVGSD
jgi:hypothetical protein